MLFLKESGRYLDSVHGVRFCYAYCLMNNHYHFFANTPDGNFSKGMR